MYSRHCYYDSWCYRDIPDILTRFQDNAKEALHVFPSMFNIFGVKVLTVPLPFQVFYLLFQLFQLLLSPCSVEFFYSMHVPSVSWKISFSFFIEYIQTTFYSLFAHSVTLGFHISLRVSLFQFNRI